MDSYFKNNNETIFIKTVFYSSTDLNQNLELFENIVVNKTCFIESSPIFKSLFFNSLKDQFYKVQITIEPLKNSENINVNYQVQIAFHFLHFLHGCNFNSPCYSQLESCQFYQLQNLNTLFFKRFNSNF